MNLLTIRKHHNCEGIISCREANISKDKQDPLIHAQAEFSEMNNILNEVDINYFQTAIHLRSGIDTLDTDKLLAAVNYMNVGTEKLTEASELAKNMNQ